MEDGFGNYIYIILMIVVLVISLLGKKRKQKETTLPGEEKKISGPDLFKEFLFGEEQTKIEDQPAMDIEKDEEPVVEIAEEEPFREGVSALKDKVLQTELEPGRLRGSLETLDQIEHLKSEMLADDIEHRPSEEFDNAYEIKVEENEPEELMDEFDLGKAVIYSEILKRREFGHDFLT